MEYLNLNFEVKATTFFAVDLDSAPSLSSRLENLEHLLIQLLGLPVRMVQDQRTSQACVYMYALTSLDWGRCKLGKTMLS